MPTGRLLSEKDLSIIKELREFGVLADVKGHQLNQKNGTILVTCSDGDQMYDIFTHQVKMQNGQCQDPRIHTFAWHGGALRLASKSPINQNDFNINLKYKTTINNFIKKNNLKSRINKKELVGDLIHDFLIGEISSARNLKKINTVALYNHATCLMAKSCNLDFLDIVHYLISAKNELKKENHGVKVGCFCHVDYTGIKDEKNPKKTYFVSKRVWEKYLKLRKIPLGK